VKEFMEVGVKVGRSTSTMSMGEAVGAVVVDRTSGSSAVVIAAAGDARWRGISEESRQGCGNAAAHAVMRAIGLVARKRRSFLVGQNSGHQNADTPELFVNEPITSLETDLYEQSTLAAGGYLCHDLELYVTHEPCVMCSMAINHSRFGRVVFGECMLTGGLGTQNRDTNGSDFEYCTYGLWWRPELNWKFLTWSWVGDDDLQTAADVHA